MQAADRSNAGIGRQPSAGLDDAGVDGHMWSGVTVAQTIRSRSSGVRPAAARALRDAVIARVPAVSFGPTNRRSRMPVRVRIHSSEVST